MKIYHTTQMSKEPEQIYYDSSDFKFIQENIKGFSTEELYKKFIQAITQYNYIVLAYRASPNSKFINYSDNIYKYIRKLMYLVLIINDIPKAAMLFAVNQPGECHRNNKRAFIKKYKWLYHYVYFFCQYNNYSNAMIEKLLDINSSTLACLKKDIKQSQVYEQISTNLEPSSKRQKMNQSIPAEIIYIANLLANIKKK